MPDDFATRIRAVRGNTVVKQFAFRIGVTSDVLRAWEVGRGHPTFLSIASVADRCGVSIEWLVAGRGPGPETDPNAPLFKAIGR